MGQKESKKTPKLANFAGSLREFLKMLEQVRLLLSQLRHGFLPLLLGLSRHVTLEECLKELAVLQQRRLLLLLRLCESVREKCRCAFVTKKHKVMTPTISGPWLHEEEGAFGSGGADSLSKSSSAPKKQTLESLISLTSDIARWAKPSWETPYIAHDYNFNCNVKLFTTTEGFTLV